MLEFLNCEFTIYFELPYFMYNQSSNEHQSHFKHCILHFANRYQVTIARYFSSEKVKL